MLNFITQFFNNKSIFVNNKCFKWNNTLSNFEKIDDFKIIPSYLLLGIDNQKKIIVKNTNKFAQGFKTNNALLWGVRGNGKSTLIKSTFNEISEKFQNLKLIEINKNDINQIIKIFNLLKNINNSRFIIFIDDLSFEKLDPEYKNIKSMLEGNISHQPNNVIIYATSNRRHLMSQDMIDNEKSSAIHKNENIEEKVSLSDRFGLWIGFHNLSQNEYINIFKSYSNFFKIKINEVDIKKSLEWSIKRGNRTGRTAWQYILELASDKEILIDY